jgi:hypothetical protein
MDGVMRLGQLSVVQDQTPVIAAQGPQTACLSGPSEVSRPTRSRQAQPSQPITVLPEEVE